MENTEQIKDLSQNPGVYIFKDKTGRILYIGKATNLKSRVGSYFRNLTPGLSPYKGERGAFGRPVMSVLDKIAKIETRETDSVLEALILEANLIKKHQPKYNVDLKDDKSFSYVVITKEEFPRVIILRQTELDKIMNSKSETLNKFKILASFGPYTSKKQLEIALKIIRKIFPYHSRKEKTEKGCLDHQIGLCPGPYAGEIAAADYGRNIRNIRMILSGKKQGLIRTLGREMAEHSKKQEFEKAAEIRNKIFALEHIRDIALISRDEKSEINNYKLRIEAYDISNISGQQAVGSMIVFNNNEPDKSQYRKFKIKTIEGANDVAMMAEVLFRRFQNSWPKPDLILLDGGKGHLNMAEKVLSELKIGIPLVAVAKGPTRKNSKIEILNPEQIENSKFKDGIKKTLRDIDLIKQVIDEAHRFAIAYHRKVRKKEFF